MKKTETDQDITQKLDLREAPFPDASEISEMMKRLTESSAYRLAFKDDDFMSLRDMRGARLQLEMLKPDMTLKKMGIYSTVVVFGGTRIISKEDSIEKIAALEKELESKPDDSKLKRKLKVAYNVLEKSHFYDEARRFARIVSGQCQINGQCDYVIVTGGGPGVMEAANRGAWECGARSIGLNIVLPDEQSPNPFITPELCFQFHYFTMRKMHFLMRARALVAFPGGYGTLDELFEALTLVQTRKARTLPIILFGKSFWEKIINFDNLVDEGVIDPEHLELFSYAETAEEAWEIIRSHHDIARVEIT
ncbi:MAG: TIGR00730 family Rossman fold protein [candidate division Zixibacteria bacterium]|nr:TIGR00730 family Rossman fold protein [candidate division Zixibacteria bacterium]